MEPPKLVSDTNILVSSQLRPDGNESLVIQLCLASRIRLCSAEDIFEEDRAVLLRPKFRFGQAEVAQLLEQVRASAIWVAPKRSLKLSPDADDNKSLECALEVKADSLVTGNVRHFPPALEATKVVTARTLLSLLDLPSLATRG